MKLVKAIKAFFNAFSEKEEEKVPKIEKQDVSHLRILSMLQQSSRLVDFLMEDISQFSDAQVGAAVRKIHQDSGKVLEELVTIRSVIEDKKEGEEMTIPKGYDSSKIKIVGKITGDAPYVGKLIHRGWKAHKQSLPKSILSDSSEVIYPAEIEVR